MGLVRCCVSQDFVTEMTRTCGDSSPFDDTFDPRILVGFECLGKIYRSWCSYLDCSEEDAGSYGGADLVVVVRLLLSRLADTVRLLEQHHDVRSCKRKNDSYFCRFFSHRAYRFTRVCLGNAPFTQVLANVARKNGIHCCQLEWSVHTALQTIASNIKEFASKFSCKSAYASCVNCSVQKVLVCKEDVTQGVT